MRKSSIFCTLSVCPRARQLCVLCAQHKAAAAAAAQLRAEQELPSFSDCVCVPCARRIYSSAATAPGSLSSNVKASRALSAQPRLARAESFFSWPSHLFTVSHDNGVKYARWIVYTYAIGHCIESLQPRIVILVRSNVQRA
uniref:Uncharacterized protein n=1 Tax=Trichogramma kaykai TaxID=54128 RepID=A0ABD2WRK6_9HYME